MNARFRSRRYVLLFSGFAIFLLVLVVGAFFGGDARKAVLSDTLSEDFSTPSETWDPMSDGSVAAEFVDGTYRIGIETPDYTFVDEAVWSGAEEFDSIQAQALVSMTQVQPGRFGILCYTNPGTADAPGGVFARYEFFLTHAGGFGVAKWLNGESNIIELKAKGPIDPTEENDVLVQCRGSGEATQLRMSVNGKVLLDIDDPDGLSTFEGTGVVVGSEKEPGLEVTFEEIVAGPLN